MTRIANIIKSHWLLCALLSVFAAVLFVLLTFSKIAVDVASTVDVVQDSAVADEDAAQASKDPFTGTATFEQGFDSVYGNRRAVAHEWQVEVDNDNIEKIAITSIIEINYDAVYGGLDPLNKNDSNADTAKKEIIADREAQIESLSTNMINSYKEKSYYGTSLEETVEPFEEDGISYIRVTVIVAKDDLDEAKKINLAYISDAWPSYASYYDTLASLTDVAVAEATA